MFYLRIPKSAGAPNIGLARTARRGPTTGHLYFLQTAYRIPAVNQSCLEEPHRGFKAIFPNCCTDHLGRNDGNVSTVCLAKHFDVLGGKVSSFHHAKPHIENAFESGSISFESQIDVYDASSRSETSRDGAEIIGSRLRFHNEMRNQNRRRRVKQPRRRQRIHKTVMHVTPFSETLLRRFAAQYIKHWGRRLDRRKMPARKPFS